MSIVYPFLLQNGQTADATQVMANFNAVQSFLVNIGNSSTQVRVVTAGATIPVALTDQILVIRKAVGSATLIQLPVQAAFPLCISSGLCPNLIVKDGKGDAAVNNITIVALDGALIDGQASFIMNGNRDTIELFADGTGWNIR